MPTIDKTAEQFIELMQRFISLRPKLILPEHIVQFKKKMEGLKNKMDGAGGRPENHSFVFRDLILFAKSNSPPTLNVLGTELNDPMITATRIVDWLERSRHE